MQWAAAFVLPRTQSIFEIIKTPSAISRVTGLKTPLLLRVRGCLENKNSSSTRRELSNELKFLPLTEREFFQLGVKSYLMLKKSYYVAISRCFHLGGHGFTFLSTPYGGEGGGALPWLYLLVDVVRDFLMAPRPSDILFYIFCFYCSFKENVR